jgi:hypothetical protein
MSFWDMYLTPTPTVYTYINNCTDNIICTDARAIANTTDVCTCSDLQTNDWIVYTATRIMYYTNNTYSTLFCNADKDCVWTCDTQPHNLPAACVGDYVQDKSIITAVVAMIVLIMGLSAIFVFNNNK